MIRTRTRLALVGIALLVTASALPPLGGTAVAAEHSFVLEQGSQCYEVSPLRGSEDVASFYDYRRLQNTHDSLYSSYMPRHIPREDVSRLFLYEGPGGVSLVIVHNTNGGDDGDGSAATFRFSGLPSDGGWVVQDDDYPAQDDRFYGSRIDWSWFGDRTDGAAFRGLDRDGTQITIDAAFDEQAALYDDLDRTGHVRAWQFLTGSLGDPSAVGLDPSRPVTIRTGHCGVDETPPSAALTAEDGVAGHPVVFDARDSTDDVGVAEYRWDFDGDGQVDRVTTDPTVQRVYDAAGTYDATVTVVDDAGNADTASAQVGVEADDPPSAAFEVTGDAPTAGFSVTLDAGEAADDVGIAEYRWDFDGDGEVEQATSSSTVAHTFEEAGDYEVSLTVFDGSGQNATANRTVSVDADDPPEAAMRVVSPETPVEGDQVVLSASNATDDTGIAEYRWTLGDNVTASGERVAYTFDGNGTFPVTLEVVDEGGNNDTRRATVEVLPPDETAPNAALDANRTTVEADVPVGFDASGSSDDRSVAGYRWTFGDGASASGRATTHAYGSPGNYTATVFVTDGGGNRATANVTVEVRPARPPNVSATVPDAVTVNRSFDVTGSASDSSGVAAYRWDFAGTAKSGKSASHAFESVGNYTVTLTAVDRGGHANATTRRVEVLGPDETPPTAALSVGTDETKTGTKLAFDASDSSDARGVVEYRWDFDGDGTFERRTHDPKVTKTYGSAGTYDATVVVADVGDNTANATVSVRVKQKRRSHRDSGGGGGGGGGGATNYGPPPVVIETEERGPNAGLVDVRNGRADETIQADLPESDAAESSGVAFRSIAVDLASDDPHFVVETARSTEKAVSAESLPADAALGSVSVDVKYLDADQVENVTYEIAVERSRLADAGVTPGDLSAYRRTGDGWKQIDARIDERDRTVVLKVRTGAFASLAVGADLPVTLDDAELAATAVSADEPVSVTATLRNEGETAEAFTANLTVDGEVATTKTVSVPGGEMTRVTVETTLPPGTHELSFGNRSVGTVTVAEPVADVGVTDVSLNSSTIGAGEEVAITATVENSGSAEGEQTITLTLFGEEVASRTVTVPAGETKRVTFVRSVDASGTYTATVGNQSATLKVTGDSETTTTDAPSESSAPIPGLGVGATVAALLAALLIARRLE